jgi:hypothetical protein
MGKVVPSAGAVVVAGTVPVAVDMAEVTVEDDDTRWYELLCRNNLFFFF